MDVALMKLVLIKGSVFFATTAIVLLIVTLIKRVDPRIGSRLQLLKPDRPPVASRHFSEFKILLSPLPQQLTKNIIPNNDEARRELQARMIRAGIYRPNAIIAFFVARLVAMMLPPVAGCVGAILGFFSMDWGLLCGACLGGLGLLLPGLWLDLKIADRHQLLRRALPDFLDLFVACVESGMTLQATMGLVSEDLKLTHPEIAAEFNTCNRQIQFGSSMETAIYDLAERTGLEELRSFSTFVQQSHRFGTAMGGALRELSDMLRMQREMQAEETAQKAAIKILIPTLLFIFPAVFVVLAAPAAIRIHEGLANASVVTSQKP